MADRLNVYEMYNINGHKTGFKIVRKSWRNIYAIVKTINGQSDGKLKGLYPYYSGQDVIVDIYNNDGTIQQQDQILRCPGTGGYTWIREKK